MSSLKYCAAIVLLTLCGCASKDTVPGREIQIRYAEVIEVSRKALPSAAPAGAVVGGFTGLVLSRRSSPGRQLASGVGGAVLGGLATRALEGERLGYAYLLEYMDGSRSEFITEKGYLVIGDCVAVESGQYKNLRRVSSTVCDGSGAVRAPRESHVRDAEQCHRAKEQLLIAQGKDAIDEAARKVEVVCAF